MKYKKRVIIAGIIISIILIIFISNKFFPTGQSIGNQEIKVVPLTDEERLIVAQAVLSSEMIKDIPKKESINLRFYKFENGQRVWQDGVLLGRDGFLTDGNPALSVFIHSKYIRELNDKNLCNVIKKANQNGDLGTYTEYSNARLLIKYSGLMKYRECF